MAVDFRDEAPAILKDYLIYKQTIKNMSKKSKRLKKNVSTQWLKRTLTSIRRGKKTQTHGKS